MARRRLNQADPTARDAVGNAAKSDPRTGLEVSMQTVIERKHAASQARAARIREARQTKAASE